MAGCPMHRRYEDGYDPFRITVPPKVKESATKSDFMKMMRPFYWPGRKGDSAHKKTALRILIILFLTFLLLGKTCSMLSPYFLGRAVDSLTYSNRREVTVNLVLFSVFSFLSGAFDELRNLSYSYVQLNGIEELSLIVYSHIHTLSYQWFVNTKSGETVRTITRGLDSIRELSRFGILMLFPTFIETFGVILIFLSYFRNVWLAIALVLGLSTYVFLTISLTNWRQKIRRAKAQRDNDFHSISNDGLNNFETVKCFTNEGYEIRRYTRAIREHEECNWVVNKSLSLLNSSQETVKQITVFACLILITHAILNGGDNVGSLVSIQTYLYVVFRPLFLLGTIYSSIVNSLAGVQGFVDLLKLEPDVVEKEDAKTLVLPKDDHPQIPIIEFRSVNFSYLKGGSDNGESMTLSGISFLLEKGKSLAIVGPTGSGKTTICRLICRFMDLDSGSILISGVEISDLTKKSLRNNIGVVMQDTVLFHSSIRENIRYAKLDATDDEIYEALKQARLYDRVMEFPNKLDTIVGERGLRLSGGEKQRVSIARCFLKDPPIIILDEATSSLDPKTEVQIQDTLYSLFRNRTVIVITHRLSTIVNCDNILLLDHGKIVGQGTHSQLLKNTVYFDLWNAQQRSKKDIAS